ncbi:ATP-grasp domain-containing protein [Sphaerisporangium dianthi]|uniref:RimK family alpha-L-glutamate ligase n=1 Tax=Sphaerisporangium dianthi TaxID=1436120 RepID=A0ABV9CDK8_9ACTN
MLAPVGGSANDLPSRLHGPPVTVDLRSSHGTVSWSPPKPDGALTATPCVVLADRAGCGEFAVLQTMLRRLGVPSVRIDAEGVTALDLSLRVGDRALTLDGRRIAPTVVWARHFSPRAMPGAADPALTMVRADSWAALARQLASLAPSNLPMSGPGHLEQLAGAARAGVRVPETTVTTDPAAAATRMAGRRFVVKVVDEHFVETAPGLLVGVFPQIAHREELTRRPALDFPVMVQEYVEHDSELRVYYVDGAVHAYAVAKPSPDSPWRDGAEVPVTTAAVPAAAAEAVRRLAELWGLAYGAFDLLLRGTEVVFLEVNVDGDWRWFESRAGGTAVSAAAALMIRKRHLDALRSAGAPPPIEIVDFLLLGAPIAGRVR